LELVICNFLLMFTPFWLVILGIPALIALFLWFLYNSLVTGRARVDEAWSGIDVQLKRRSSLIPNLVETVKGYAGHEKELFENVANARSALLNAKGAAQSAAADNQLSGVLKTLFAVAENYPELKANENFKHLQEELSDAEDKIAYSRQFFNSNVMSYNVKIKQFPAVLVASSLGFKAYEFFEAAESDRQDIKVAF